jgi:hypothetical protein
VKDAKDVERKKGTGYPDLRDMFIPTKMEDV